MAETRLDILLARIHRLLVRRAGRLEVDEGVKVYLVAVPEGFEGAEEAIERALERNCAAILLDCSGGPDREDKPPSRTLDVGVSPDEKLALFGRD